MTEMYKITSMDSGAWCSLTCNVVSPEFVLTYALDQWTTPKAGRILVFDTLENAIDFLWENGWITEKVDTRDDIAIWQCEAVNPVKVNSLLRNVDSAKDVEGLSRFWSGEPDFFIRLTEVPKGTYGAERVRLTKKVWPDD